jgi:hypothetical protein
MAAGAAYLAVSAIVWWHLWGLGLAHGISQTPFGDSAQDVWFLAWVPHALGSGLNPFVSRAMFAPKGINLMLNTSILLPGFVLIPITEVFGPLVSFNVAVVLAPTLNALVAFMVFRRWAPFALGRWLAGLFYGFSPFVLNDLVNGHLHVTLLVFPPVALMLFDDLLVRERGNPVVKGTLLGVVFAAQFLTGEEVAAIMLFLGASGVVLLAIRHPREALQRWRRAAAGLAAAGVVGGVLLAVPLYELLAGPLRFQGTVFPDPYGFFVWLKATVWPRSFWPQTAWPEYAGIPLLAIVCAGCARIRSGVIRFAAAMSAVALVFALSRHAHWVPTSSASIPLPDALFSHWPFLKNLLPIRFDLMVDLFLALCLAIVLDRVHGSLAARLGGLPARGEQTAGDEPASAQPASAQPRRAQPASAQPASAGAPSCGGPSCGRPSGRTRRPSRPKWLAGLATAGLGALALISPALSAPIPYAMRSISVPAVYRSPALTHVPRGTVLLGYPIANGFTADPLVWQAEEHMPYDMVAGYGFIPGPGPRPIGSLPPSPAVNISGDAQVGLLPPTPAPSTVAGVRRNLESWHVTLVVEYLGYLTFKQPARLAAVIDAATGTKPQMIDGAYVWRLAG